MDSGKVGSDKELFKRALCEGVVVDTVMLLYSAFIMNCGEVSMRIFFAVIAHLTSNFWLYKRGLNTFWVRLYLRFGVFVLMLVIFGIIRIAKAIYMI